MKIPKKEFNFEKFEKLLVDFRGLQPWKESPQTFLEIGGFQRHELPCSNILKFFFNPTEEHKLEDLFLKSLLEIYDLKAKATFSKEDVQFNKIEREEITETGKYIDVMILAEPVLIGIENKMHAPANYNPYGDYNEHLVKVATDEKVPLKNIVRVILGLRHYNDGKKEGYYSITFDELFDRVSKSLGQKVLNCEQRYLPFLIDFMNTIKNQKQDSKMEIELCEFLQKDGQETATIQFITRLKKLEEMFRAKIKSVSEKISAPSGFTRSFWGFPRNANSNEMHETIFDSVDFNRVLANDVKVCVQAGIGINGWAIEAWSLSGNWSKPKHIEKLEAKPKVLGFDAPEDEIAKKCEELLKEIAKL